MQRPNLFYAGDGSAYYAAAIGIVRDAATGARDTSEDTPARSRAWRCALRDDARRRDVPASHAGGDGAEEGGGGGGDGRGGGAVRVWGHPNVSRGGASASESSRAVAAVGFSPDGAALTTVGCDDSHTVHIWDWRARGVGEPRARRRSRRPRRPGRRVQRATDGRTASSGIRTRPSGAAVLHVGQKTRQDVDRGPSRASLVLARHVLRRVRRGGCPRGGVSEASAASRGRRRGHRRRRRRRMRRRIAPPLAQR